MTSSTDDGEHGNARWDVLRRQIEALRALLIDQGSIVAKRRGQQTYWYLRYSETGSGSRQQRSVYIGSEQDARRAQALLDEFRAPGEYLRETLRLVELASNLAKTVMRRGDRAGT